MEVKRILWLLILTILMVVPTLAEAQSETERDQTSANASRQEPAQENVMEVAPGITRYGEVPQFADVGRSQIFEVVPNAEQIVFAVGQELKYWDLDEEKITKKVKIKFGVNQMAYSADGLVLAISGWNSKTGGQVVSVFDAVTDELVTTIDPSGSSPESDGTAENRSQPRRYIQQMAVSPDGDYVALGFGQETEVYSARSADSISTIKQSYYAQSLTFSADGKSLFDSTGRMYDVESGEEGERLPKKILGQYSSSVALNLKRNIIGTTSWNQGIRLYNLDKKKKIDLEPLDSKNSQLYSLAFSDSGRTVAAASYPQQSNGTPGSAKVYVWDIDSGKLKDEFEIAGHMQKMRFSSDGKRLISKCHGEYGLTVTEIGEGRDSSRLRGNTSPLNHFQFLPGEDKIVATATQGGGYLFDLNTGELEKNIPTSQSAHLGMSEDGEYVVFGARQSTVGIHKLAGKKTKYLEIKAYASPSVVSRLGGFLTNNPNQARYEQFVINQVGIDDENELLHVTTRGRRSFRFESFNLKSGKKEFNKRYKMKRFWAVDDKRNSNFWRQRSVVVSADGQHLAVYDDDKTVFVLEPKSGDVICEIEVEKNEQCKIYFTRDSSRLMVLEGQKIRTFDAESGGEGGGLAVGATVAFTDQSRDGGRMVVVCNNPMMVKVFDLENNEEVFSEKLKGVYMGVGINDDGSKIAMAKDNCQFEIWDLEALAN